MGLSNYVSNATFGAQVSLLFNRTGEELFGTQVALVNSVKNIEGKNFAIESKRSGLQIGFVNLANKMNGFQLGLINYSKKMQGTQIGLINFGETVHTAGAKQGTFIGLLNMGSVLNLSVYSSELFLLNTTMYTGVQKNGQIKGDFTNRYILNGISWSKHPTSTKSTDSWALSYEITRQIFNRSIVPGMNEKRFYGYYFHYYHISPGKKFDWNLNEVFQLGLNTGIRIHPKIGIYGFLAVNLNAHIINSSRPEQLEDIIPFGILQRHSGKTYTIGPGVNVGLLAH